MSRRSFALAAALLAWPVGCASSAEDAQRPAGGGGADEVDGSGGGGGGGSSPDGETPGGGGGACTAVRDQVLAPVDKVSSGAVTVLSDDGVVMTLLIDATAGGPPGAAKNPRIYVNLETGTRVDVTDPAAAESIEWDLAIKRPVLFTNGGDGGSGSGGAVFLPGKDFEQVTRADAEGAAFASESFFDADCEPRVDARGDLQTSFSGWYDYEFSTHVLTPKAGTWLVKGAAGALFKVRLLTFYADPNGEAGGAPGRYTLQTATL